DPAEFAFDLDLGEGLLPAFVGPYLAVEMANLAFLGEFVGIRPAADRTQVTDPVWNMQDLAFHDDGAHLICLLLSLSSCHWFQAIITHESRGCQSPGHWAVLAVRRAFSSEEKDVQLRCAAEPDPIDPG